MSQPYRTTDLSLASFLVAQGHKLTGVESLKDGRRGWFVFEPSAAGAAEGFFLNEPVPARDFAAALKQLKAAIHAL